MPHIHKNKTKKEGSNSEVRINGNLSFFDSVGPTRSLLKRLISSVMLPL